jgi:hypothetical protein
MQDAPGISESNNFGVAKITSNPLIDLNIEIYE